MPQIGKENFDLLGVGFFVDGGVGADPEALGLGGLDGLDGQVEQPRPPQEAVVGRGQAVQVDAQGEAVGTGSWGSDFSSKMALLQR